MRYTHRMRALILLFFLATPAAAWEFSAENGICRLTHAEPHASVEVTYTLDASLYAITLTKPVPWTPFPLFAIAFNGPRGLTISTDRQTYDGTSITVTDSGFGNVLNGLEFNDTATAILGEEDVTLPLTGAAPEVQKFRACAEALAA